MPETTSGLWSPQDVYKRNAAGSWVPENDIGMVLINPSSFTTTGTGSSATMSENGSITFSSSTGLSLNGVFSRYYDNYMIVFRCQELKTGITYDMRMRAGGVDDSSNSYTYQQLRISDTTETTSDTSNATTAALGYGRNLVRVGFVVYLYGPYLTQVTAGRTVTFSPLSSATIEDYAFTVNSLLAYDGFTINGSADTFSGNIAVYGLEN